MGENLPPLLIVVLPMLIGASALFSAIETALFSLRAEDLERFKTRRADFAAALDRLMENPRRLLSAILLGDTLVNIPLISLSLYLVYEVLPNDVPVWAAALVIFTLIVFICDLVPKQLALAQPERIARLGVRVMGFALPVIDPLARGLQRAAEWLADALIPASLKPNQFLSEDELGTLVDLGAEEGALHESESEMIHDIIKLGDKTACDCMTPRVDTFTLPDDLTNEELIPKLRERRYRRVPVYGETPDDILGVLDVQAFLLDPSAHYTERLVPPSFVAETMKALDLLRGFLSHPQGLAFVVDEHGGIEGMVTLADLVEEVISDAVPVQEKALYIEPIGEGRLLANGNARLDDLSEWIGFEPDGGGIDTIGGLVFNRLGTLPKPGVQLEIERLRLTVRRTSRKRIEEIEIDYTAVLEPGDDEGGEI